LAFNLRSMHSNKKLKKSNQKLKPMFIMLMLPRLN